MKKNNYIWLASIIVLLTITILSCYYEEVSFSLTIEAGDNGTVDPPGTIEVANGKATDISAIPDPDHHFAGWEVISGDANTLLLTESYPHR